MTITADRQDDALRFLAGRIDYERAASMPHSEEAFKLDRMRELLEKLGNPQERMPIVHVAGTKGKGSTAAMVAAVLGAAGYRTGLFTSPHLDRVEERISIDGRPCSDGELVELVELVRPAIESLDLAGAKKDPVESGPTYFEILTAMALCHFARQHVRAAVLEVGLGGRLDSTNVCRPVLSIITSISLDHTKQLGDTLAAIAAEKAGIIKPGVPVISGVTQDEPREVVRTVAGKNGCRLIEQGVNFDFNYRPPRHLERGPAPAYVDFRVVGAALDVGAAVQLPYPSTGVGSTTANPTAYTNVALNLLGRHQAANAALTVAAVDELRRAGWTIPEAAVRRGLAELSWPARVEVVGRRPTVILDAAHNAASIAALAEVLDESFAAARRVLVFATTLEKDVRGMLPPLLRRFDEVILTRYLNNPRGIAPEQLLTLADEVVGSGGSTAAPTTSPNRLPTTRIASTPAEAWDMVRRSAGPDDLVCITGSFFIAAEMRGQLAARPLRSYPKN